MTIFASLVPHSQGLLPETIVYDAWVLGRNYRATLKGFVGQYACFFFGVKRG